MGLFLPISLDDMKERGWNSLDFVYISGDAYVDHPSFGPAILSRLLEKNGYRVGVIPQPQYPEDFLRLGEPKYAFLVSSGNVDSMVAHYTVAKRRREKDSYSPGNQIGLRPDRAVTVYTKQIRKVSNRPVIIGGIEASLRRFAHYDYWKDTVLPSILEDSGADLLIYGMGEKALLEIAGRLSAGESLSRIRDVKGTCYLVEPKETPYGCKECPSFSQVSTSKESYAKSCRTQYLEQDEVTGKRVIQRQREKMLVQNPPMPILTQQELDEVFSLPYQRAYHPIYEKEGGVPALEEVQFSIAHNRGCYGDCNFCAIALHQGRRITARSEASILEEAKLLTGLPNFKGYIHDVGGPTANFRHPSCEKQLTQGMCRGKKCLAPTPCPNLKTDHREYCRILRKLRELPGVKKVFIRSGIRYDYVVNDTSNEFLNELVCHHVSGQLKVAPEHCANAVLECMGKPPVEVFEKFMKQFYKATARAGKEQYLVPYLMSSHPGSRIQEAIELAVFLKRHHIRPEQVQDFYPTPGTISTCMFYTGLHPLTMKPVYVPKTSEEKAMQRALLQYYLPKNRNLVLKALKKAGRFDLIGTGPDCLIRGEARRQGYPYREEKKWQREERTTKRIKHSKY